MARYRMRDVIVVLPGITGSVLSDPSGELWNLSGQALWSFAKTRGDSLRRLAIPEHDPRNPPPATDITATRLIEGFHGVFGLAKIDGYRPLYESLKDRFDVIAGGWTDDRPANLLTFAYDWRLSNRASANRLAEGITRKLDAWRRHTGDQEAKVLLIAHSMGGLVSRYWLEVLEGWRDCRALVTFGTPYRGSLDAVRYVAHGYKKAFVDLTTVLLSCPSVYELLPIYRAVEQNGAWYRPHEIELPVLDAGLRSRAREYTQAAAEFHVEIRDAARANAVAADDRGGYAMVPFAGVHQQTQQSARITGSTVTLSTDIPSWIEDDVEGGDGTVPRVSAIPPDLSGPFGTSYISAQHATLHNVPHGLDDLVERLRQSQSRHMGDIQGSFEPGTRAIDLVVDDVYLDGEPVTIQARAVDRADQPTGADLRARLESTMDGGRVDQTFVMPHLEPYSVLTVPDLPPGRYRVTVQLAEAGSDTAIPVQGVFEVSE
jgi:pimeloyl-ACP methyl ester carboxylesterase